MDKVTLAFGGALIVLLMVLFAAVSGALIGSLGGWGVHFIFPATSARLVTLTGFQVYQLGAIVGFIGGAFRTVVRKAKDD